MKICLIKIAWKLLIVARSNIGHISLLSHLFLEYNLESQRLGGDRENRSASTMMSTLVYRYRGFNCRKKQFSRSYRNNLNSAWKKINAACLPFITNVYSLPRRLSYAFAFGVQNASTETQFNVLRYGSGWGRKGEEMGERQGTIIVAVMRSFFFCLA